MRVPDAGKPYIAAWLIEQRKRKGWTQAAAIDALVAANIGVARGSYPAWETGVRKPNVTILTRLADFYETEIPAPPSPPLSEESQVAAAIDRQTAMLERMLQSIDDRLRLLDEKGTARTIEVVEAVAEAEAALAAKLPGSSPARNTQPKPATQPGKARPNREERGPSELEVSRGTGR